MLTEDLEWFVSLADTQHVTATAALTHLSQPTLSRKLARLERQVGVPLFDRHGRRLALNQYGRILYDRARIALDELSAALRDIDIRSSPETGTIRLDFLHSFGTWLIPRMMRDYRVGHPTVSFELHQGSAQDLLGRVLDGRADLAVVSPRPDGDVVDWTPIVDQSLALAVPSNHRFARLPAIDLTDAADEPFVAMHDDFGMRRIFDELTAAAGFVPDIVFESSELATVGGLVSASFGVAVMPMQRPPIWSEGVTYVPIAGAEREIGLIRPKNRQLTAPVADFGQFLRTTDWA